MATDENLSDHRDRVYRPHVLPHEYGGQIDSVYVQMIQNRNSLIREVIVSGTGLEIGALHNPTPLNEEVRVLYVDYLPLDGLQDRYREIPGTIIKMPDIVDDGETLTKVDRTDLDFIIANHFIEHCQNPILAIRNMLSKLRPGGFLVLAVPDKRFTFDAGREITDFEHLSRDYEQGPEWSHRGHYEDFARATHQLNGRTVEEQFEHYYNSVADIHFHVWDHGAFFDFVHMLNQRYSFPIECMVYVRNGFENLCIAQKLA